MQSYNIKKLPLDYTLNSDLLKLLGQTYEKLGEYKAVLKTIKFDYKILLNLILLKECVSTLSVDDEEVTLEDILYMNFKKENKAIKKLKNIIKLYNFSLIELKNNETINLNFLNQMNKLLFNGIRGLKVKTGVLRKKQNYITKPGLVGKTIIFVPPKYTELNSLMKNFIEYINEKNDETFIKLAILHYQFETIHPYMIGNGIIGRVLISSCFTSFKNEKPLLFISEALSNFKTSYYSSFNEAKGNNEEIFIKFFLQTIIEQYNLNISKIELLNKVYDEDIKLIKENTSGSLVFKMLPFMIKRVVFTTNDMIADTKHHINSVNKVLNRLVEIGLLERENRKDTNRKTYKYTNIYNIFK